MSQASIKSRKRAFVNAVDCAAQAAQNLRDTDVQFRIAGVEAPVELAQTLAATERLLSVFQAEKHKIAAEESRDRKPPRQRGYLDS